MSIIKGDDVFIPSIFRRRKQAELCLDELGEANLVILQFLSMRDLHSIIVANNIVWEKQYLTLSHSITYDLLEEHQQKDIEKIVQTNTSYKYKQAIDAIYKMAGNHAIIEKQKRRELIESECQKYPKQRYGIPKDYQEFKKDISTLIIVGDHHVGKTSFLVAHFNNQHPGSDEFLPTVFDVMLKRYTLGNKDVTIDLVGAFSPHFNDCIDTAGHEDYDRLRPLSYHNCDVFLLLFAVNDPKSFTNIVHRWKPELQQWRPGVPVVLCGSKIDLRQDKAAVFRLREQGLAMITPEEGKYMAKKMGFMGYVEASAFGTGLNEAFDAALHCIGIDVTHTTEKKECICS